MKILLLALALQAPYPALRAHRDADRALVRGDLNAAASAFELAEELSPDLPAIAYGRACVAARAGRIEEAFEFLELAAARGYHDAGVAAWDEDLASLREDPRFASWSQEIQGEKAEPPRRVLPFVLEHTSADRISCVAIDARGEYFATGSRDGAITVAEIAPRGRRVEIRGVEDGYVSDVAVASGGKLIAAVWKSGELRIWNSPFEGSFDAGSAVSFSLFEGGVRSFGCFPNPLILSSRGDRLFASAGTHSSFLFDSKGEVLSRIQAPEGRTFSGRALWSRDGERLYLAYDRLLSVLRAEDGSEAARWESPSRVGSLSLDASGAELWIGGQEGTIARFALASGSYEQVATPSDIQWHPEEPPRIGSLHHSTLLDRVAYSTATAAYVEVISKGAEVVWTSEFLGGRMGEPVEVVLSPNGRWLWFAWWSGALRSWTVDLTTGHCTLTAARSHSPRLGGQRMVWKTGDGISVYDVESGDELWQRVELGDGASALLVRPGYFELEGDRFEGIGASHVRTPRAGESMYDWPPLLYFDPKRVRAALAGVEVRPLAGF